MGPFVDDTDGKSAETGLTISQADIRLSKNGGDYAQSNNSAGATHDEYGEYDVPLDTTDTNTLGVLKVKIHESGALPVWEVCHVLPANVYDSMFSTDKLEVDVAQWKGATAQDMTGDAFARLGAPAGASVSADLADIEGKVDDLESRLTAARAGYLDALNGHIPQTGDAFARLGAPAGASVSADLADIEGKVDDLESRLTAARAGYLDALNGHIPQTGDAFARLGAPAGASIAADIAAAQAILGSGTHGNAALKSLIDVIDGIIDNIYTAFELDSGAYRLTAAALALAPGGGASYGELLAILEKFDEMVEEVEGVWTFTEEALISSPVGTGGFTAADRAKLYALVTQIDENRAASAFSYSDESTDPIHKLRRMIGDTDSSDILLTDGELGIIWADNQTFPTEKENLNLCAAIACEEIASAFARDAVKAVGDLQQNLAQKSDNYRKQARVFRARDDAGEDTTGSAGPGFCSSVTANQPRFGRRSRRCP